MKLESINMGKIVNAHGIRGQLRVVPAHGDPKLLTDLKTIYIDGQLYKPTAMQIHKHLILMKLPNVEDMNTALTYKNKDIMVRRSDMDVAEDFCFDEELIGFDVFSEEGDCLGKLVQVEHYPASDVYTIRGEREYLVPAVPEVFIKSVSVEDNRMVIHVMEGLATDEN
ncbi:ribosome maturation factor RimM [Bengtsoniella intestinalis]|uniref:ribosome maturation factor RimM n=1 Tax=Bengtsoniella intestinalis TaxID=3073143 RepID=UPI00391F1D98